MRMIKFRAWDKQHKEMIYDGLEYHLRLIQTPNDIDSNIEAIPLGFTRVDYAMFDIMQFTGLLDRNGKEIYEGDIVRKTTYQLRKGKAIIDGEVKYHAHTASFLFYNWCYTNLSADNITLEVIGNIHTTPELLTNNK